jgi:hypothetical protein
LEKSGRTRPPVPLSLNLVDCCPRRGGWSRPEREVTTVRRAGAVLIALTIGVVLALPSPSGADQVGGSCSPTNFSGRGFHRLLYFSFSSTRWRLYQSYYTISGISSRKNNIRLRLYPGGTTWAWNSPDSLVADSRQHLLRDHYRGGLLTAYKNVHAYMTAQVVFDRLFGDPACTIRTNFP